ncbi:MAG: ABC transporter permease [Actinomycetota bacterium]
MSTPAPTAFERDTSARTGRVGRVAAMSRAEMLLLWRNKTAMFTALALPLVMVAVWFTLGVEEEVADGTAAFLLTTLLGFVLLFVVYYNLVTAYVARREELVLKRLRTSEAAEADVLLATAVPALALALAQVLIGIAAVAALLDLGAPVNPVLLAAGVLGGAAAFVPLAAVSTAFTRNVEMAQITTMPVLIVSLLFSGLTFPVDTLPDTAAAAARLLPLTPVVELFQLGLNGAVGSAAPVGFTATFAEAAVPLGVLAAWLLVGVYSIRRWFRWEPRV